MQILRPNVAAVAGKVIDGEAIIMNLMNGSYYSMDGVGAAIWENIEQGSSLDAISGEIASRYAVNDSEARADLDRLVNELLAEGIVVLAEAESAPRPMKPRSKAPAPYTAPKLNKYDEMADLLALDPPLPALGDLPSSLDRAG